MNKLRIRLNDRKRFVRAAALAAVFLLLAGGANALANTVWCVTKTSVYPYPTCTPSTTFSTISAALAVPPAPLDVIVVAPGHYNETVGISVNNLSIFGAQAGRDAREGRYDPSKESIVDASGSPVGAGHGAGFFVNAANVIIDGFTVQGGGVTGGTPGICASGIYLTGSISAQVLNNIIENNAVGVFLYESNVPLVEYNLFKTNNAGAAGSSDAGFVGMAGFGIAGQSPAAAGITENEFDGNLAAAIALQSAQSTQITKNTSETDGSFAVFVGGIFNSFSHNQGQGFGAKGFKLLPLTTPSGHADAAIDAGGDTQSLQITDNDLKQGEAPNYNGIAFSAMFGSGVCAQCQVSNNRIKRFAGNGIVAETTEASPAGSGTLFQSSISRNDIEDNGNDGILIEEGSANFSNSLVDNEAEDNHVNDCEDDTNLIPSGTGTAGTHNTWFNNLGSLSVPAGLCAPGSGHHHD
jgi:parallel beta-helix repeat protein